jgi:Cofactor assembly of complex C subunit B, CCB2/CCB4
MAKSDPNRVLRLMPLVVGGLSGTLLFINRLLTPELTNSQSRSDALGVIISAVLILAGLLWQKVQPRSPDAVELIGQEVFDLSADLPEAVKLELAWASHTLLMNTVTQSVVVWYGGQTILRRGVMGERSQVQPGLILKRVLETEKPVYLVALKIYPGRLEFDYLPENTQGVICQPLGREGAMILGANAPRSYTQQDEAWIAAITNKLTVTLETCLDKSR